MKALIAFLAMSLVAGYASAQDSYYGDGLDVGLQEEIRRESGDWSDSRDKRKRRRGDYVEVEEDYYPPESQRVIINNNSRADLNSYQGTRTDVQQQPITYVEASPLADSRAEQIRKARQNAEVNTEQKIVEKLEHSRLQDEKRRAERLFGDRWGENEPQQAPAYPQPAAQTQVQQVVPSVVTVAEPKPVETVQVDLGNKTKAEVHDNYDYDKDDFINSLYISGGLGMAEYSDVDNIQGNMATGFSVGSIVSENLMVEGAFVYSNYYIDEYWSPNFFKEMDQYNFSLSAKAYLPAGRLRPYVGAVGSYVHRKYADRTFDNSYGYNSYGNHSQSSGQTTTNAFDLGLTAGLDFDLTDSFAIGSGFTYMTNVINKSENFLRDYYGQGGYGGYRSYNSAPPNTEPVEELDYYMFTVSGKLRF